MALADLTSPDAVLRALEEFDRLGREEFLARYGFEKARRYFLVRNGQRYDSKAIAGVAHGYQHPERGPLRAADFSGGDATVRARLEALGFEVVVNEPRVGPVRPLRLFEDYSRREVHDIFAPNIPFTTGAGTWGMSGIIEYDDGEFVLFVTFGRKQGEHRFDEGVTTDGVVTWQSQPNQTLADPQNPATDRPRSRTRKRPIIPSDARPGEWQRSDAVHLPRSPSVRDARCRPRAAGPLSVATNR